MKRSGFPVGNCDTAAAADGRCGSNVYDVKQQQWLQFGHDKPSLSGLPVEETDDRKKVALKERTFMHMYIDAHHDKYIYFYEHVQLQALPGSSLQVASVIDSWRTSQGN
jgi:hypothetical protein